MPFEEYTPHRSSGRAPAATISKGGLVSFNVSCVIQYFSKASYARLYYDTESRQIGIRLFETQADNCVKIVKNKTRANHISIYMQSLLRVHGVYPLAEPLRGLAVKHDPELGLLVIQIP